MRRDAQKQAQQAVAAGCKALVISARPGARGRVESGRSDPARPDGPDRDQRGHDTGGCEARDRGRRARDRGVQSRQPARSAPIDVLAPIVDAVGGKAAVIVDGSFRRGAEVVKALALGARAVLVARPVMWGLAAYGADGVQTIVEMLQSDLGRHMGALGTPNLAALNRNFVKIHRR